MGCSAVFRRIHAVNPPRLEHDLVNIGARGYAIETNSIIAKLSN
jgi:hypothetical protein